MITDAAAVGVDSSTASGSAVLAETGLKVSKEALAFLDSPISNLGTPEEIKQYRSAVIDDFKAQIYLHRFQYSHSYQMSRRVHQQLDQLCNKLTARFITQNKRLFSSFMYDVLSGPLDRRSKAKHYLHLGFRDTSQAEETHKKAYHIVPAANFTIKIPQYIKAITMTQRARRYAFLAFVHIRTPRNQWIGIEKMSFEEFGKRLWDLCPTDECKQTVTSMHFDNFGKLRKLSLRQQTIDSPELQKALIEQTKLSTPTGK